MRQEEEKRGQRRWMGVAAAVALSPFVASGVAAAADQSLPPPVSDLDAIDDVDADAFALSEDELATRAARKCTTGVFAYTCLNIADTPYSSGGTTYRKLTRLESWRNLNGPNQSTCNYKAEMQIRPPGVPSSDWKTYYTGVTSGCVSTGLYPWSTESVVLSWAGNSDVMGPLWRSGTEFCTRWWQDGNATQNYACADVHN